MEGVVGVNTGFWRGKRVFITGHTGFKGAWLSLWLKELAAHVTGFSVDIPTNPSLYGVLSGGCVDVDERGDVRDLACLTEALSASKAEIVFHLAAQSLVRASYEDPVGTYTTNVTGTVNLLEATRKVSGVRSVLVVTSDKCYENREVRESYAEGDPLGGHDPYSSSKGCAELVTAAYRRSFLQGVGVGVASVRAGNVIGGGDWSADRLLPDCARAFSEGQEVVVRNPHSIRPWQHVLDALHGYLLLAERVHTAPHEFSRALNFGPEPRDARPVSEVVAAFARAWGSGARAREERLTAAPHEAALLMLDSSLARETLGWRPTLGFERGVERTAQWYKAFYQGEDMLGLSRAQIREAQSVGEDAV